MTRHTVPLFPLQVVLFPEGPLPLRIFEPRYLDMISRCMKTDSGFGVVLIATGTEAGSAVRTHAQGTLARICDWDKGDDGLLSIMARGTTRFRLLSTERQDDGLNMGLIEDLPPEPQEPLTGEFQPFAELLRVVLDDLDELYSGVERRYDDASWVGYRLAEILPLELPVRQMCLEMDDPLERLEYLRPLLPRISRTDA